MDSLKIHVKRFTSRIRLAQVFIDVLGSSLFLPKALNQKLEKHSGALDALVSVLTEGVDCAKVVQAILPTNSWVKRGQIRLNRNNLSRS